MQTAKSPASSFFSFHVNFLLNLMENTPRVEASKIYTLVYNLITYGALLYVYLHR